MCPHLKTNLWLFELLDEPMFVDVGAAGWDGQLAHHLTTQVALPVLMEKVVIDAEQLNYRPLITDFIGPQLCLSPLQHRPHLQVLWTSAYHKKSKLSFSSISFWFARPAASEGLLDFWYDFKVQIDTKCVSDAGRTDGPWDKDFCLGRFASFWKLPTSSCKIELRAFSTSAKDMFSSSYLRITNTNMQKNELLFSYILNQQLSY